MFCLYSKGCEYAIRAMAAMAAMADPSSPGNVRAKDVCRKADIPEAYARKTFQALVQNGFLRAIQGPGGGYALARDARNTTVMDVVEAVEGKGNYSQCLLGLASCSDKNPCTLHFTWIKLRGQMISALRSHTLSDLSKSFKYKSDKPNRAKGR